MAVGWLYDWAVGQVAISCFLLPRQVSTAPPSPEAVQWDLENLGSLFWPKEICLEWQEKFKVLSYRSVKASQYGAPSLVCLTGLYHVRIILPCFFRVDLLPSVCAHQEVSDPGRSDSSVDMATGQSWIGYGTLAASHRGAMLWFLVVAALADSF